MRLSVGQLAALVLINVMVVTIFAGRWWMVLKAQGWDILYLRVVGYRLAGFAVSYFTPGPHFGGEPLQVYLLRKRHSIPTSIAAASVVAERAIELLANFTFLSIGVGITLSMNLISGQLARLAWGVTLALAIIPAVYLAAARRGRKPVSAVLSLVPDRWPSVRASVHEAEDSISELSSERLAGLLGALGFSILSWLVLIFEFWVALQFLGLDLNLLQTVAVATAARLAILLPFPGGLGALEASQVLMISSLGYSLAEGAAMGLLIRARDLAFGGAGATLGWLFLRRETP
jgi:uncharacterized protein (TIRG00374 family)